MSINISASLIRDYLSCRSKVFYRVNHPELSISNKEMLLGVVVHKSLEKYWYSPSEALEYITKSISVDDYDFCIKCIQNYHNNFQEFLTSEDEIEKRFKIEFSPGVYVVGKMDRITKDGLVFDWKTNRKTPKSINNDPQFILYHWAYTKIYNKPPQAIYYASLTDGSLLMLDPTKEYYTQLFEEIIPFIIQDIKNHSLPRTGIFTNDCYRCSYMEACLQEDKNVMDNSDSLKR